MVMDMIEHETTGSSNLALATRAEKDVLTIGTGADILNRTFLIKKMEIEYSLTVPFVTDVATVQTQLGFLALQMTSAGSNADTIAESFDATLEDKSVHDSVIWSRNFIWYPHLLDTTGNDLVAFNPNTISFKTSKSFPKGYPLDKDEVYTWKVFNQSGSISWLTGSTNNLRVRYWGVYL